MNPKYAVTESEKIPQSPKEEDVIMTEELNEKQKSDSLATDTLLMNPEPGVEHSEGVDTISY